MKKVPRKIPTPQSLANVALHYLGQFAASESSLRRVLTNRIKRVARENALFASDLDLQSHLRSVIETIIAAHKKNGVINDAAFAETKINSLRRQGRSRHAIEQRLRLQGITDDLVQKALELSHEGHASEEVELKAALALARKRKLGTFRQTRTDDDRKRKDFGVMARAGFSSSIARLALNHEQES